MEKQKKYALRKIAGYGLVSCAVGFMIVGVTQVSADEVTGPSVIGQPLEQPKTNPAISSRAKEAFATAIAKLSKNSVLTGSDIQTGEGITDALPKARKEGMSNVRTAFDRLPEILRRVPKSVQFYAKADGKYGFTDSLGGNVSLNACYYENHNLDVYDRQFETLYHELSHVIDGATYTNNDGTEYSLSRDEQVAPLLERVDRNAPVYETWASAFARYTMSRMFNKVERDGRYQPLMLYFDELLGEALFGSRGYTPNGGMIPSHQSGVQVTMTDTGLKITIDNDKVFLPSERIAITLTGAAHNILPNGPLTINDVEVGHAGLMYIGRNEAIRQTEKWVDKANATSIDALSESDFDELMDILTQRSAYEGVYEISVDANKINALKDRTIQIKVLEDRVMHPDIEKRYLLDTRRHHDGLRKRINHSLIQKWVDAHSQDWRIELWNWGGYLDRLQYIPNVGDYGEILFNQASVYRYPMQLIIDLNELLDDAKPRDDVFEIFLNHDYDTPRKRVSIAESPSYENYKEQLEDSVVISSPSRLTINGGWGTGKPRVFAPGDIRYEYFLNTEDSGLSVKPELIGTTQHISKDYVNDFVKAPTYTWSPDRSFVEIADGEKLKNITTHYEWDIVYEKDKVTIVNTNEVHMPKYARTSEIGPKLEIGKEVLFQPEIVFDKLDQWEYDKNYNYGQGGWRIPGVSAYHHSYYHDSLNNETKEFTSKPEAYELPKRKEKDIIVDGEKIPHQVTVQFVDALGNKIALDKTIKENAYADEIYTYEPEMIEGYQYTKLANDSAPLKGFVGSKDKVIKLVYKDVRQPVVTKENTTFTWTIHFQDENDQTIREDAKIINRYTRDITTNPDGTKVIGEWTFVDQTTENVDDLQAVEPTFGEKTTKTRFTSRIVIPGRHGEKYLAKTNGQWKDWRGLNLAVGLDDYIYLQEGEQKADVYGEYTVGYQAKDANINVRLVDADNPDTVYKSVDVPAFYHFQHNGLDTHVFDSFKSEGELLDTIPSEVALENDGKIIDIRLKKDEEFTTTVKVKNEKGDVLKEVQVTGKHDSTNRINYGDLSEINKEYDTSKLPDTLRIDKDQSVVEYVVSDKLYTAEWKVFDSYNVSPNFDTPIASGKVTGKYGEKLSDKLDLSQYHIDKFSTNRLNRYRFGIELVSGDTLPNKTMYTFFAPPKPVKKCNVYIQYVDDKDALVYPTKRLILEEGQTLRDYAVVGSSLLGLPGDSLPDDNNRFNLGDTLELYGDFTLSNKEDVLNYTVNASGDQIVKVIYNRKEVNSQATFKDALGREINQTISYQGKMYDKLSDETVEQIRQALLANKENHPDVLITLGDDKQYTDVDTFLNDLPNLRFGDGASRISVQYGVTITKTYDLATETSFTRLLIPDALGTYINHFYKDVTPDKTVFNYYPKSSGDLYDVNTPYVTNENGATMYVNRSLVLSFIHSLGSLESDELFKNYLSMEVDTSNLPSNPTIHNTQPLTLTIHVAADGQVTVSDVQVGEKQGDSPVSLQVPGFDTYIVPQSLNNRGDEFLRLIEAIRNAEVSEETFKLDDGVDYQLGSGLTTKDIQTLNDNLRETGKLANFTEDSLDELVNQKLNAIKIGEPLTSKLQLDGNHIIQKVADQSFLFLLAPKIYHNKVKVVNEDGDVLLEKTLTTKFKDTVHYDMTEGLRTIENDYVTFDDLSGNWTANTENQEIIIHAKKRFVPKTETKQVKRRVRFHDGKQVVGEEEQVVTFTRTVTTDRKTDEVAYSDWESEHPQFDELKVAEKEDKTSNVQSVPEKAVTAEDKDEIVDVYYGPKTSDSETQTKATIHVVYHNQDGTIYKEFDVQADKGSVLDGSDLEMLPDDMDFTDDFATYEVKGDGTDHIERTVKKQTADSETQTKASIHVVYRSQDGTIYKEFDVQADKGTILDGSDLEMLPDDMNFTDEFTTYEVKGDGTDAIERTVKKQTADSETQTKASIHVVYKNADGTVYKEFDVQADKGSILDGSDLQMLPDDMDFTDEFTTYEVKGDGTDHIERTVKKDTSDNGTQTDTPTTSDGGTQTDNPDTSDSETQTKARIHVVYRNQDGAVYKEFDVEADKGSILDGSDLEMLPDDMNFTDDFMFYEVKGDGTDSIERTVKKQTSDSETQTKATIHVVYKNADGTVYKEFDVQADAGTILDGSDLEMLPDDMDFTDDFTTHEVKGDGTDHIERTVKKQTLDNGTQTEEPNTSENGTQTEEPNTSENGTQTDNPDTSDNGTQTDEPNTSDNGTQTEEPNTSDKGTQTDEPNTSENGTQTKVTIHVIYRNADGTVYKEFDVQADKGAILDGSDLEMIPDDMDFTDDFMFYEVKGDGTDHIERTVKKQTSENGTQTEEPNTSDNGTQTEEPNTSDNGTQTEEPNTSDNGTQTEEPNTSDNGTQTEEPNTSDNGTQTDEPNTSDNGTQTEEPNTSDNGTQTEEPNTSDNGTQTDEPNTSDNGTQTDESNTSDNGTQTDESNTSDNGTQTDTPDTSDNGTQTDTPDTSDNGTQTDESNTSDKNTQTVDSGTQTGQQRPKVLPTKKSLPTTKSRQLPKTGMQTSLSGVGAFFIGLAGVFTSRKKKREE